MFISRLTINGHALLLGCLQQKAIWPFNSAEDFAVHKDMQAGTKILVKRFNIFHTEPFY